MNLDLFDAVPEPEGAEETPPPVPSPPETSESPTGPSVWTVSEINQAVRSLLEDHLPTLWISGEVANWKRAASGHCYFTLKDESSQLRCVMWRGDASRLPLDPDEGMEVRVFGQVTLYEARGDLQLVARQLVDEEGEGLWRLAYERLRKKLDEEGLLGPERKRPLPSFPETVGVVTSLTGAALHDILTVLRRRAPWLRVVVAGTRVQGEGAAEEVARAIRRLEETGGVEVLIVGRGGGSREDLWAFNEEPVARAIAASSLPVVSAVGHEVDVTIADLVADVRAPTPSAAAEAVAPNKDEILRYLAGAGSRLAHGLRRGLDGRVRRLREGRGRFARLGPRLTRDRRRLIQVKREVVERLARTLTLERRRGLDDRRNALVRAVQKGILERRNILASLAGKVEALSPLSTLRRGYGVPLDEGGGVLRTTEDFTTGESYILRVVDGRVRSTVQDIEPDEV